MEITIRPMTETERMYSYTQSHQLIMQTGCIGHLRADFGSNGKQFFSTWDDHRTDLKSDSFKAEFDEVINTLREDTTYRRILRDRTTLSAYCQASPDSSFRNERNEYGFRVDSDHYSYFLRLTPNKGDYNIYCYCYLRQWLDRHMRHAEKGIRFITTDYKELFRISDGDKIRIITNSGDRRIRTCRYIDDYHMETSGEGATTLYHICEFAEKREQRGCQDVIPLRSSLPDQCFSVLETTGELIILDKGEKGYRLAGTEGKDMAPREAANVANAALGVTKAQEAAMVAGSMFGFHVLAADPRNYDESGTPLPPKRQDRGMDR